MTTTGNTDTRYNPYTATARDDLARALEDAHDELDRRERSATTALFTGFLLGGFIFSGLAVILLSQWGCK